MTEGKQGTVKVPRYVLRNAKAGLTGPLTRRNRKRRARIVRALAPLGLVPVRS